MLHHLQTDMSSRTRFLKCRPAPALLLLPCREAGCRRPPTKALFCLPLVVVKGTLLPAFGCGLSKGWLLTTSNKPGLCAGSIVESEDVSALHSLSLLCYAPLLLPSSPHPTTRVRRRESILESFRCPPLLCFRTAQVACIGCRRLSLVSIGLSIGLSLSSPSLLPIKLQLSCDNSSKSCTV